jgi:hypothetical protein
MDGNIKIGNPMNVFVSSKDILRSERDIAENVIRSLNMHPFLAETDKWFATPDPEEYLRLIDKSNIVILIVDLEAKISNEEEYYSFVKKEVDRAFRLGIAVLAFFKNKSRTRKKIDGFVEDIQYKLFAHIFSNADDLSISLRESILNELFKKYAYPPLLIQSIKKIYTETCLLVDRCKYRFYLSQQTPIILLGPRNGRDYEKNLFSNLRKLIENTKNDKGIEIVFLYDSIKTDMELENNGMEYDFNLIRENIEFLNNLFVSHTDINLNIISRTSDIIQFVISDTHYLFGNHTPDFALAVLDDKPVIVSEMIKFVEQKTSYKKSSGLEAFIEIFEKYR